MTIQYDEKNRALIQEYIQTQSAKILNELVLLNYPLVIRLSRTFQVNKNNVPDLIQEGCIGLICGIKKFDPNKGKKLSSYISLWIRAYMFKFIVHNSHITKLVLSSSPDDSKLFYNLKKEQEKLKNINIPIDDELEYIAKSLNIDIDKVKLIDSFNKSTIVNFDKVPEISGNNTPDKLYEELDAFNTLNSKVEQFKLSLNSKEQLIFNNKIVSENPCTFEELGAQLLISKQRVQQIETKIRARLQKFIGADYSSINSGGV